MGWGWVGEGYLCSLFKSNTVSSRDSISRHEEMTRIGNGII